MPFAVTHATSPMKAAEYHEYLRLLTRLLLKQGVNLTDVPRTEEEGTPGRWLYVWRTLEESQDFLDQLKSFTESGEWIIREVTATSRGPLRPLELQVGQQRDGWTFALAPWARKSIQARFPDSCQSNSVFIATDTRACFSAAPGGPEPLARHVLAVLTGLSQEQLQLFGSYVVTDPVSGQVLLSPTLIRG